MARLLIFVKLFVVLIATTTSLAEHTPKPKARPNQKPHTFVFPVLKDTNSDFYYTNVTVGEPPFVVKLVVDISGEALWFQCEGIGYNSTTYTPTLCGSRECKQAKGQCSSCSGRNDMCTAHLYYGTPVILLEDNIVLTYTSPSAYVAPKLAPRLPLACMSVSSAGIYIPSGSHGTLGLGNGSMSFVNRLVSTYKIPFKVALCLPSKPGINDSGLGYIGGGPYLLPPNRKDVSGLLVSSPLIVNIREDVDDSYYIDVRFIEVNEKPLSFDQDMLTFNKTSGFGGTMIRSTIRYTYLDSSIYKALVKAFARNAKKRKAVEPFTDCFSSKSFGGKSFLGKKTPVISLVLGGGAKWKIYGPNSLVKVSKDVVCLAFMNGGGGSLNPILIGGYQIQDNLVEFDLEASRFSITSSLLLHNTSCSRL